MKHIVKLNNKYLKLRKFIKVIIIKNFIKDKDDELSLLNI